MVTSVERQRERVREHYRKNPQYYIDKARRLTDELVAIMLGAKKVPCMDCGISYPPYVMDFDHRDPTTKVTEVSKLVRGGSRKKLIEEIDKCDVVCSNCHRERTYGNGN